MTGPLLYSEERPENYPQCLSGLSRAVGLFPTTFLKTAVLNLIGDTNELMTSATDFKKKL